LLVPVDVLAEIGIARNDERLEPGRAKVADQSRSAVRHRHVCGRESLGQRALVHEGEADSNGRRRRMAVLDEDLDVWSLLRQHVAPRDESLERVMIGTDQAQHLGFGCLAHNSSPITCALR
jgi:hypothetical protein